MLLALALPGAPAQAYKLTKTEGGDVVLWLANCRTFYMDPAGWPGGRGEALTKAVSQSILAWDEVECSDLTVAYGGEVEALKAGYASCGNNRNEITFLAKWSYMQEAVAYTTLTYLADDGTLVDADIECNLDDYELTLYPADNPKAMDLQSVLTHEMGHAVGLDHSADLDSTMYFSAPPAEVKKRTLNKDDREGLCQLYPAGNLDQDCGAGDNSLGDPYKDLFCDDSSGATVGGCGVAGGPGGPGGKAPWGLVVMVLVMVMVGVMVARIRLLRARLGFWGARIGLLLMVLAWPAQAGAFEIYSSNGNLVHWPAQICSIPYYIDSKGLDEIEGEQEILEVRRAFKAWGDLPCSDFYPSFQNLVDDAKVSKLGPNRNDVVFMNSGWKWESSYVMLTIISFDPPTGEIYDVDIAVNSQSFDFSLCQTPDDDQLANFKFTILHEAGHFTGLAHSEVEDSLMYAAGTAVCSADLPTGILEDDQQGFCSVYASDLWKCSDQILPDTVEPDADASPDTEAQDTVTPTDTSSGGGGGGGCGVGGGPGEAGGALWLLLAMLGMIRLLRARLR